MSQELEEEPYNYDLTSVRGALQIFFDMGTDKEINKINFGPRSVRAHEIYSRNLPTPAFETADEHSEEGDRITVLSPNKSPQPEQTPTILNESIFPAPPVLLNVVPPPQYTQRRAFQFTPATPTLQQQLQQPNRQVNTEEQVEIQRRIQQRQLEEENERRIQQNQQRLLQEENERRLRQIQADVDAENQRRVQQYQAEQEASRQRLLQQRRDEAEAKFQFEQKQFKIAERQRLLREWDEKQKRHAEPLISEPQSSFRERAKAVPKTWELPTKPTLTTHTNSRNHVELPRQSYPFSQPHREDFLRAQQAEIKDWARYQEPEEAPVLKNSKRVEIEEQIKSLTESLKLLSADDERLKKSVRIRDHKKKRSKRYSSASSMETTDYSNTSESETDSESDVSSDESHKSSRKKKSQMIFLQAPTFDTVYGRDDDIVDWFKNFELVAKASGWDKRHMAKTAPISFKNEAQQVYQSLTSREKQDYDKIKKVMIRKLKQAGSDQNAITEYHNLCQMEGETLSELASRLTKLVEHCPRLKKESNRSLAKTYLRALDERIGSTLQNMRFKSVEDVVKAAERNEAYLSRKQSHGVVNAIGYSGAQQPRQQYYQQPQQQYYQQPQQQYCQQPQQQYYQQPQQQYCQQPQQQYRQQPQQLQAQQRSQQEQQHVQQPQQDQNHSNKKPSDGRGGGSGMSCLKCGSTTHKVRQCDRVNWSELANKTCTHCYRIGHTRDLCPGAYYSDRRAAESKESTSTQGLTKSDRVPLPKQ